MHAFARLYIGCLVKNISEFVSRYDAVFVPFEALELIREYEFIGFCFKYCVFKYDLAALGHIEGERE